MMPCVLLTVTTALVTERQTGRKKKSPVIHLLPRHVRYVIQAQTITGLEIERRKVQVKRKA